MVVRIVTIWAFDVSLGLVPNYIVSVLGNECGGPQHVQGHHTWDLGIKSRKIVGLKKKLNTYV